MNLLELLMGSMTAQSSVSSVSGKTGLSSKQVQKLMMLAIPILIKYMTKNASSGSGALSLLGALSQHTSKNDMAQQLSSADEKDGGKIVHHILGKKEDQVTQDLSAQTGLNASQVSQFLSVLAPALMSGVSEAADANAQAPAAKPSSTHNAGFSPLGGLSGSGIFGTLLGLGKKEQATADTDSTLDGTDLLMALLNARK